jgi:hypothetical protein
MLLVTCCTDVQPRLGDSPSQLNKEVGDGPTCWKVTQLQLPRFSVIDRRPIWTNSVIRESPFPGLSVIGRRPIGLSSVCRRLTRRCQTQPTPNILSHRQEADPAQLSHLIPTLSHRQEADSLNSQTEPTPNTLSLQQEADSVV